MRFSTYKLHTMAKLLPLRLRRKIALLKLMFVKNMDLKMKQCEGIENRLGRTRQSKFNFVKCDFPKTEWFKSTASYLGPKYWEILPTRLKAMDNYLEFKKELDTYYVNLFLEEGFV